MDDLAPGQQPPPIDSGAGAACCPGGVCGPIFETSLVELVFRSVRLFARRGNATRASELTADPILDLVASTAPLAPPANARLQKDAPQ